MAVKWEDSEQAIQVILTSAGLEKHFDLFKNLNLDTFLNLTEEDLLIIGICDKEEQEKLLKCLEPFHGQFKEFTTEPKLNILKTMSNSKHMLLYLHADTIQIKRFVLNKENCKHDPIIEPGITTSSASRLFLEKIDTGLGLMEKFCENMLSACDGDTNKKKSWSTQKIGFLAGVATLCTLLGGVVILRKY